MRNSAIAVMSALLLASVGECQIPPPKQLLGDLISQSPQSDIQRYPVLTIGSRSKASISVVRVARSGRPEVRCEGVEILLEQQDKRKAVYVDNMTSLQEFEDSINASMKYPRLLGREGLPEPMRSARSGMLFIQLDQPSSAARGASPLVTILCAGPYWEESETGIFMEADGERFRFPDTEMGELRDALAKARGLLDRLPD
jgi:hypothetical protein